MTTGSVLMCPPLHYDILYEINPWMDVRVPIEHERAIRQWQRLTELLRAAGVQVEEVAPVEGLPDMVFTANAGLVRDGLFVPSLLAHQERQAETAHFVKWFEAAGYSVAQDGPAGAFEGAGDACFFGDSLLAGYRTRSDITSHAWLAETFGCRVISLELVDERFYHLDLALSVLDDSTALWYPEAFDAYGRRALEGLIPQLIEVSPEEAGRFCCNAVVLEGQVIVYWCSERLEDKLGAQGFSVTRCDLGEFVKAGGSARCLMLDIGPGAERSGTDD